MKPGDIVDLKSGSPALTVTRVYGDIAEVVWLRAGDQVGSGEFPQVCLSETNHSSWTAK